MATDAAKAKGRARIIAINDCWRLAPFADLLYAADAAWWDHHQGVPSFAGEKWTQDKGRGLAAAQRWNLKVVRSELRDGLSLDPQLIHQGYNSGFQALNLAVLFGAARVILLGFDMKATGGRSHWFGDHPAPLLRGSPYNLFVAAFDRAAPELVRAGIDVINCSRETALTCFRRASLDEVWRD